MTDFSLNLGLTHTSGHNPPVGVAFQFLLVGRLSIEFNGRYSASKLMTAVAQPGHQPPVAVTSKFLVSGRNERLVFGNQIDRENFRTRPSAARGGYIWISRARWNRMAGFRRSSRSREFQDPATKSHSTVESIGPLKTDCCLSNFEAG